MNRTELTWLGICAAVASGIALALAFPRAAELWPEVVGIVVLIAALGYGFSVRGWWFAMLVFVGLAIGYESLVETERSYRLTPWMRNVERRSAEKIEPSALRSAFSRRVALGLDHAPEVVSLNRAILLGERKRLSPELKRIFVDSGAIHIFAISGLHVMVMAKILMSLVALLFVPLRYQGLIALPFLWGYVALIGAPPSAVRAGLMASFYFAAPVAWRRPNGVVSWAISFLIVHVVSPEQLKEVGSLFSFVVMLAIVIANRYVRLKPDSFGQLAFLTCVAWAAGVPIAAATFGRLTPGGLLANLLLVSTAAYTVVASALGVLASFIWDPLAAHFNNLAALVTDAMVVVARAVASLPFANLEIPPWGVADCLGWYTAFGLFLYLIHHIQERRRQI